MTQHLLILARAEPGVLQRVLTVLSRRGHEPVGVVAHREDGLFRMEIEISGQRSPSTVIRNLRQLHDVEQVDLCEPFFTTESTESTEKRQDE